MASMVCAHAEPVNRPTMAVFEDVHWADEATLDLLGFLARRLTRCSLTQVSPAKLLAKNSGHCGHA